MGQSLSRYIQECLFLFCLPGSVHDLEGGAAPELLLHVRHDTHSCVFVCLDRDLHQLAVSLAHRVALGGDEVTDVVRCLERVIQLDTRLGTVLALILSGRGTDVDV